MDSNGQLQVEISGKQKYGMVPSIKSRRELELQRQKEEYFQKTLEGKTVRMESASNS